MVKPSSSPCIPCIYKGYRCYMGNSNFNSKEDIVGLNIVDENITVTPYQQCQTVPSTPQGETLVVQNNPIETKDWNYETPQRTDKMWARSTSKLAVRFQTPQFTPMKRFDFEVMPTPVPKEILPIEPDTPTPVKCIPSPCPKQKSPI